RGIVRAGALGDAGNIYFRHHLLRMGFWTCPITNIIRATVPSWMQEVRDDALAFPAGDLACARCDGGPRADAIGLVANGGPRVARRTDRPRCRGIFRRCLGTR